MGSLSREVLAQVVTLQTPAEVWSAIHTFFAAQTQSQLVNTRISLANLQKGNMGMPEYLAKIKALTDEIAYTGSSLGDGELVSFILKGLDMEYNSVVSALSARVKPVTVTELCNQLISFESRINLLQQGNLCQSSANALTRGRGYGGRGRGHKG